MKILSIISLLALSSTSLAQFADFTSEVASVAAEIKIGSSKITPASDGLGALYGNISGTAQTVKLFINEKTGTNETKNIKFLWNDWHKNMGYGLHPDKKEATYVLACLANLYAPEYQDRLKQAFFGNKDETINTGKFVLQYTFHHGPGLDERMLIIREPSENGEITAELLEKTLREITGYKDRLANIDLDPVDKGTCKSYYIVGQNRDSFWVEIYPDGKATVNGVYRGNYPFKELGAGRWK